jgi:hypothetical protein
VKLANLHRQNKIVKTWIIQLTLANIKIQANQVGNAVALLGTQTFPRL